MSWQDWMGWRLAGLTTVAWLATVAASVPAIAQGTLRIAMTATDVPTTTGVPNNGFEGVRFMGFTRLRRPRQLGPEQSRYRRRHRAGPRRELAAGCRRPKEMDVQAA